MWSGIKNLEGNVLPEFTFAGQTPAQVIGAILPYIFAATGAALVIYIVMGGISLMLSMGDPKAVAAARGKITNGILGAIIVVFAYLIVQLIGKVFNLQDFNTLFK